MLELSVESSTLGADMNIAGQNLPSFGSRKVETKIRLRDGESTLLAGLLREDERARRSRASSASSTCRSSAACSSSNDNSISQTDIVMLLTPHIVRTHELRQQDVNPIYIGTQQNLGLGGPPPLIAPPAGGQAAPGAGPAAGPPAAAPATTSAPGAMPGTLPSPGRPCRLPPAPLAGAAAAARAAGDSGRAAGGTRRRRRRAPRAAARRDDRRRTGGVAQVVVTPPGTRVPRGRRAVHGADLDQRAPPRMSTVSLTLTFSPAQLRVRSVQEGSFMRQGGATATFTQQVDAASGRIDIDDHARAGPGRGVGHRAARGACCSMPWRPGRRPSPSAALAPGPPAASCPSSPRR